MKKTLTLVLASLILNAISHPAHANQLLLHCIWSILNYDVTVDFEKSVVTEVSELDQQMDSYTAKITNSAIEWRVGNRTRTINRITGETKTIFHDGLKSWAGRCSTHTRQPSFSF